MKQLTRTPTRSLPALLILLAVCMVSTVYGHRTEKAERSLKIPALGRTVYLGHVYNEVLDEFLDVSVFSQQIPESFIRTSIKQTLRTTLGPANSYQEKMKLLNIQDTVAANVLSGVTQAEGSASFLNDEPFQSSAPNAVSGALVQKYRTTKQSLEIYFSSLKAFYNVDILNHKDATHVVTGIEWGADTVVQFTSTDNGNLIELLEQIKKFMRPQQEFTASNASLSLSVKSDIPLLFEFSQNPTQVYNLLRQLPEQLATFNFGKGIPTNYILTPLSLIKKYVLPGSGCSNSAHEINEKALKEIISQFDEIASTERRIKTVYVTLNSQPNCLLEETREKMEKLQNSIYNIKSNFKKSLKEALEADRTGCGDGQALFNMSQSYKQNELNTDKVKEALSEFKIDLKRTEFCHYLQASHPNIEYVGQEQSFDLQISQHFNKSVYVLFIKDEFSNDINNEGEAILFTFLNELNQPGNKLYIVDCDFEQAKCNGVSQSVIRLYRNGRLVSSRVERAYEDEVNKLEPQIAQPNSLIANVAGGNNCEAKRSDFTGNATKSASFGCGGTIQVPSGGESIVVDFTLGPSPHRCLWTLDAGQNNFRIKFKVKLKLLCQNQILFAGDDENTLTFTEWYHEDTLKDITTNWISSQNRSVRSNYVDLRGFLSFTSQTAGYPQAAFILRIDVLDTVVDSIQSSSSVTHNNSIGSSSYSLPSALLDVSSIVINPQPAFNMTLTVDYVDSDGESNPCESWDSVDILEFGTDGVPKKLGRYCGQQSAISFKAENPVAALFLWWGEKSGRGVKLSWK